VIGHYVRRFFTSLSRRPPPAADEAWVAATVTAAELALFARLSNPDRRHLARCGRELERLLGADTDPTWVRASILHDVGKVHAGLGTVGRSVSTVLVYALGASRVRGWADRPGWRGRCGRYECHADLGATDLEAAGSPPAVVAWARDHHHPERFVGLPIPGAVVTALGQADR
jgi:hypothetical protein